MSYNLRVFFILFVLLFILLIIYFLSQSIYSFLSKKTLNQFRILFPTWRFFEGLTPIPKISFRTSQNGIDFGPWINLSPYSTNRSFKALFFNPEGNHYLAFQCQVEQLIQDISQIQENEEISQLTSYNIVFQYLKKHIQSHFCSNKIVFQFKIDAIEFNKDSNFNSPPRKSELVYSNFSELR